MNFQTQADAIDRCTARLVARVAFLTVAWHPEAATITRRLAAEAQRHVVTKSIPGLAINSAVLSRYQRAKLPTPKRQLMLFRAAIALELSRELGLSGTDVAGMLGCSSPQSWGRHIKRYYGTSGRRWLGSALPADFWTQVVLPALQADNPAWETARVLTGTRRPEAHPVAA